MAVAAQTFSRTNLREFAFTADNFRDRIINHVFSHSPALLVFASQSLGDFGGVPMQGAGHRVEGGGHAIIVPVTLGAHSGATRMAGPFGTHNVSPDDNTRLAEANWRFYSHGLAVSKHDIAINTGDHQRASFIETQTREVLLALADLLADDLYATTLAPSAIDSLFTLIGTGTVQGLAPATYANYHSRGLSARGTVAASVTFTATGPSFAAAGISDMRTAYNNASEGMIQPSIVLTSYDNHERYEGALQPAERFAGANLVADGSFRGLAFRGKPVVADPKCAAGDMYFLNVGENGIQLSVLGGFDFDFDEFKPSSNQPVMVRPLYWTGQLVIHDRRTSNRITGFTD